MTKTIFPSVKEPLDRVAQNCHSGLAVCLTSWSPASHQNKKPSLMEVTKKESRKSESLSVFSSKVCECHQLCWTNFIFTDDFITLPQLKKIDMAAEEVEALPSLTSYYYVPQAWPLSPMTHNYIWAFLDSNCPDLFWFSPLKYHIPGCLAQPKWAVSLYRSLNLFFWLSLRMSQSLLLYKLGVVFICL